MAVDAVTVGIILRFNMKQVYVNSSSGPKTQLLTVLQFRMFTFRS